MMKQSTSDVSLSTVDTDVTDTSLFGGSVGLDIDDSCDTRRERRGSSVSFGQIEVREYERIPGDHPETSLGVPLSIGWAYKQQRSVPLDRYERETQKESRAGRYPRPLGAMTRKKLLMEEFHVPLKEIVDAERQLIKFKKQLEELKLRGDEATDLTSSSSSSSCSSNSGFQLKSIRKRFMKRFRPSRVSERPRTVPAPANVPLCAWGISSPSPQ